MAKGHIGGNREIGKRNKDKAAAPTAPLLGAHVKLASRTLT